MEGGDDGLLLNVFQAMTDEEHEFEAPRRKVSSKDRWRMTFRTTHQSMKRTAAKRRRAKEELVVPIATEDSETPRFVSTARATFREGEDQALAADTSRPSWLKGSDPVAKIFHENREESKPKGLPERRDVAEGSKPEEPVKGAKPEGLSKGKHSGKSLKGRDAEKSFIGGKGEEQAMVEARNHGRSGIEGAGVKEPPPFLAGAGMNERRESGDPVTKVSQGNREGITPEGRPKGKKRENLAARINPEESSKGRSSEDLSKAKHTGNLLKERDAEELFGGGKAEDPAMVGAGNHGRSRIEGGGVKEPLPISTVATANDRRREGGNPIAKVFHGNHEGSKPEGPPKGRMLENSAKGRSLEKPNKGKSFEKTLKGIDPEESVKERKAEEQASAVAGSHGGDKLERAGVKDQPPFRGDPDRFQRRGDGMEGVGGHGNRGERNLEARGKSSERSVVEEGGHQERKRKRPSDDGRGLEKGGGLPAKKTELRSVVRAPGRVGAGDGGPAKEGGRVLSAEERAQVFDESSDFASLGLAPALATHLQGHMGFSAPTHIQRRAIPLLVSGRDALVHSDTGSGKTLVYLAPILNALQALPRKLSRSEGTFALVLAPTRELCLQIYGVAQKLLQRFHWIVPGLVIGGENKNKEKARLRKGVTILMATPGRLLDHLRNTVSFNVSGLRHLVFDEADRLLDLGFERDIMEILSILKSAAAEDMWQTVLLSATLDQRLDRLASVSLRDPVTVGPEDGAGGLTGAASGGGLKPDHEEDEARGAGRYGPGSADEELATYHIPSQLSQVFVKVPCRLRLAALAALLRSKFSATSPACKLAVFFSTCDSVEFHHALFAALHVSADRDTSASREDDTEAAPEHGPPFVPCPFFKLHGNLSQKERSEAFHEYKAASRGVLLCTDVAARGLDFPALSCIVQYDPPGDASDYVHRVGRTARLGQKGEAVLFLQPFELDYLQELSAHTVTLTELPLIGLLDHIPFGGGEAKRRNRGGEGDAVLPEMHKGAAILQFRLESTTGARRGLRQLATDAYRSFVRAYAAHKGPLKKIFHPKRLHLGHVAKSFALKDAPSMLGQSSTKQALKKQKEELSLRHQRKKRRLRAATMVE